MFGFRPPPPPPPPPPPTLTFKQSLLIYCAVGLLILLIYASLANFKRQNVSFGRSWDARLQTLAVFSGSLQLFIPLIGISFWVIVKALLASNYTAAAAVLYLVRKRRVAARQPHRQASMPTVGGDDEAEVEA